MKLIDKKSIKRYYLMGDLFRKDKLKGYTYTCLYCSMHFIGNTKRVNEKILPAKGTPSKKCVAII